MTQTRGKYIPDFTEPADLTHEFFTMDDGRRMHVATVGSGDPLVFVHGWPEFWLTWMPVANILKREFKCIMPCLYGFGLSDKPENLRDDLDANFHANDIRQLIEKTCDKAPVLVGHDIGSYVLQCCATGILSNDDGLQPCGLIFFNCPTPSVGKDWVSHGHLNEIWYQSFHLTELAVDLVGNSRETKEIYLTHFLKHWSYSKKAYELFLPKLLEIFELEGALHGGFSWYKSNNPSRLETIAGSKLSHIPKIDIPTAVLWGRYDPILKANWARHIPDNFRNVTIEFAEEAGHFVHFEQPKLAAGFVRSHTKIWRQ